MVHNTRRTAPTSRGTPEANQDTELRAFSIISLVCRTSEISALCAIFALELVSGVGAVLSVITIRAGAYTNGFATS